jgi:DNA-binding response OmpR family regulator
MRLTIEDQSLQGSVLASFCDTPLPQIGSTVRRIIIADENRDLRNVLAFKFEHQNDTVIHADNVKDAFYATLEDLKTRTAIIIGDFGRTTDPLLTLVHDVRANFDPADLPIIVVSSHAFPYNRKEALEAGANAFIPRPIQRLDEVVDAVNALLKTA